MTAKLRAAGHCNLAPSFLLNFTRYLSLLFLPTAQQHNLIHWLGRDPYASLWSAHWKHTNPCFIENCQTHWLHTSITWCHQRFKLLQVSSSRSRSWSFWLFCILGLAVLTALELSEGIVLEACLSTVGFTRPQIALIICLVFFLHSLNLT